MKAILDLSQINQSLLDGRTKGFPLDKQAMPLVQIGAQAWSIFKGDLPMPVAIIREKALDNNVAFMAEFTKLTGLSFAPHGKTTMAPHLYEAQLKAGAWGITFATVQQANVAISCGLRKVLIANQVISAREIAGLAHLLQIHSNLEIHVLVDSVQGIERLNQGMALAGVKLNVLVEIGHIGGRAGVREVEQAIKLCEMVYRANHLQLTGLECYEGLVLSGDDAKDKAHVKGLVEQLTAIAMLADKANLFECEQIILSAGGSAAFDFIAQFLPQILSKPVIPLLRSGCVVTHDHGFFAKMFTQIQGRLALSKPLMGELEAALEVWSIVQSCPEPGLAILSMGKRDVSYDLDLPKPIWHFRDGQTTPNLAPAEWKITKLNDQHAYLNVPLDANIQVGDLIGCGISHPCTTFDKWDLIYLVDENYAVKSAIRTYF